MTSSLNLALGTQLDVYSERHMGWLIGTIIDMKDAQTKVHYLGWTDEHDIWLDKNSRHLAPLNTHTLPITLLSKPPASRSNLSYINSKAIVHQRQWIFQAAHRIQRYDMENDTYSQMETTPYSDLGLSQYDRICYDTKNALIYITNSDRPFIIVLDPSSGQVSRKRAKIWKYIDSNHVPIMINQDKNDKCCLYSNNYKHLDVLHFFDGKHGYYNKDTLQYVQLQPLEHNGKFIHIPHLKKVILVNSEICYELHTNPNTGNKYKAKFVASNIKPPPLSNHYSNWRVINIYNSLIVIINMEKKSNREFVFYDFISDKWYKSKRKCPIVHPNSAIIDGKDDQLYFMTCFKAPCLFKVQWMDIIPRELRESYKDRNYKKLIHGFVRNIEKRHKLYYNVPFYLKEVILQYFPCFMHV